MKTDHGRGWRNAVRPHGPAGSRLTLAENGATRYRIVVPEDACVVEQNAARQLAFWLQRMTGAEFPVVRDVGTPGREEIRLGRACLPDGGPEPGRDGISIRTDGQRLLLRGGAGRGLLNAVFALLEEDLGCRWYGAGAMRIPECPTLEFAPVERTYTPQLKLRDPYYFCSFDGDWSMQNRTNAPAAPVPAAFGGYAEYPSAERDHPHTKWHRSLLFAHTYSMLLPPDLYAAEHPEYFEMDAEGNRRTDRQLCETHPDVVRIVKESVLRALRAAPHALFVSVSRVDGRSTCQCPSCRAVNEAEGSNAATLLGLVNQVAATVEAEFPDVTVTTLAYLDTIKLPRTVRPRHNVGIRLCNDQCAWPHPFTPVRDSSAFADIVKEWASVCRKLYIWDYVVNFSHYAAPMPNLAVIADNIRFWCEHNAEGIMTQGGFQSHGAERDLLKSWVVAKLMWDPSRDVFELAQDFIGGYFGAAAAPIAAYNELLCEQGRKHALASARPVGGIRFPMDAAFLRGGFVEQADALYRDARAAASGDPELVARVERDYLPVLYVRLQQSHGQDAPPDPALIDEFERIARRVGFLFPGETPTPSLDWLLDVWRSGKEGGLVSFTPGGGTYKGPVAVRVTTPLSAVRLTYTLDDSTPSAASPEINGPVAIEKSGTLRVAMFMLGSCCGMPVGEAVFTIGE